MTFVLAVSAFALSFLTLLVVVQIAQNVNAMQQQLNTWLDSDAHRTLDTAATDTTLRWEADIRESRNKRRIVEVTAATEGDAVIQLMRRGIDQRSIKDIRRA